MRIHGNGLVRVAARLALVVLAIVSVDACAAVVDARLTRIGDDVVIEASATVNADGATAWRVLTDYARYRNFIPGVRASRVLARHGSSVVVEQSDEVAVWRARFPVRVTYEIAEFPPRELRSFAKAPPLPSLSSTFELTNTDTGVRIDYVGRVESTFAPLGRLLQPIVEQTAIRDLEALAAEIERRSGAPRGNG
ncbi:MAG TPA: SRPBCC family protein [Casimicrobiaceae bacterium]|nr:SRPBCC family protein [Casimicrobiaceae bacterium]